MTDETTGDDGRGPRIVPKSATDALRPRQGPTPPRRSRKARSQVVVFFNLLFSAALFLMLCGAAALYWGKLQFEGPGPLKAQTSYVVPRNATLESIAGGLERGGIVSNARIFEAGVRLANVAGELKAGEYGFEPGATMRDVMEKLRTGSSILHSVTIPEGWTVRQIYDRVAGEDVLTGDLPPPVAEGTLRPDTYRVQRGMSRADLIAKMSDAQTALVKEIWDRRSKTIPVADIGEFVTLASIVEKETGRADERPLVASVFINRLKQGMRLQSDPTIIYGIWGGAGKPPNEPIRQSHLKSDTPYNTYVVKGLPPGPIANPGRAALEAVANPSSTDDVYFVADGAGGHVFAKTLGEHNANVKRYREFERQRDAAAPADDDPEDPIVEP